MRTIIKISIICAFVWCQQLFAKSDDEKLNCPAHQFIPESLINPAGLRSWLNMHSDVKSVTDLVCCLPESYRSLNFVAPSSFAGQPGTPHSPRILLTRFESMEGFPAIPKEDLKNHALQTILTVNGGAR